MSKKKLPNIIFIVLDTARAKSFSCYGYHRKTTPNIDRIGEEGKLYKWCFSPANWTIPSHASLFTGLYPSEHGCHWGNPYLDENLLTLPEILRQAGYHTVGISCNALVSPATGFARGFDFFFDLGGGWPLYGASMPPGLSWQEKLWYTIRRPSLPQLKWILNKSLGRFYSLWGSWKTVLTRYALSHALSFVPGVQSGKPLFLFLNLMQAHGPWKPPREVAGRFRSNKARYNCLVPKGLLEKLTPAKAEKLTALYDEELFYLDSCIGKFYNRLKETGALENTLLILTSDHGEMLGEQGGYLGHMYGLFPELLHIPLIIRWPSAFKKLDGNRIVQLHDLFATLVNLCGLPFPAPPGSVDLLGSGKRKAAVAEDVCVDLRLRQWGIPNFWELPYRKPSRAVITLRSGREVPDVDLKPLNNFYYSTEGDWEAF